MGSVTVAQLCHGLIPQCGHKGGGDSAPLWWDPICRAASGSGVLSITRMWSCWGKSRGDAPRAAAAPLLWRHPWRDLGAFSLELRRLRGHHRALSSTERGPKTPREGLWTRVWSDRTRGNGLPLTEGRVKWDIGQKFFFERVMNPGRGCLGKLWLSQPSKGFKAR